MSRINKFTGKLNVVGEQVKKYRLEQSLSYIDITKKLELLGIYMSRQKLYEIEKNRKTVKDFELYGLARVLNVSVDSLLQDIINQLKD